MVQKKKILFICERQTNRVTSLTCLGAVVVFSYKKGKHLRDIEIFHTPHPTKQQRKLLTTTVKPLSPIRTYITSHILEFNNSVLFFFLGGRNFLMRAAAIRPPPLCRGSLLFLLGNKLLNTDDISVSRVYQQYLCEQGN